MTESKVRTMGQQPIAEIMVQRKLKSHDLVAASKEQLTHKMVSRACKGRWLTVNAKSKVLNALNKAAGKKYSMGEVFNY